MSNDFPGNLLPIFVKNEYITQQYDYKEKGVLLVKKYYQGTKSPQQYMISQVKEVFTDKYKPVKTKQNECNRYNVSLAFNAVPPKSIGESQCYDTDVF